MLAQYLGVTFSAHAGESFEATLLRSVPSWSPSWAPNDAVREVALLASSWRPVRLTMK